MMLFWAVTPEYAEVAGFMLLRTAIDTYLNDRAPYLAQNSLEVYRSNLNNFYNASQVYFEDDELKPLVHIDHIHSGYVRNYLEWCRARGMKSQTIALGSLRPFLKYWKRRKPLHIFPEELKFEREVRDPKYVITRADMDKLRAVCDSETFEGMRDLALIEFLFATGLRISEIASLSLLSFKDFQNREAYVYRAKKGKKQSLFPNSLIPDWGDGCHAVLCAYFGLLLCKKNLDDAMFVCRVKRGSREYQRASVRTLQRIIQRLVELSGIDPRASAHSFRHGFAVDNYEHGVDIKAVHDMLGHAENNWQDVNRYTRLSLDTKRKVYREAAEKRGIALA